MAVSTISGDFGVISQMTCILSEGTITVGSGEDLYGCTTTTRTYGSQIVKGEWVAIDTDTGNTYAATGGLAVVCKVSNGVDLVFGQVIDTPVWNTMPTATADTWATMLAAGQYRTATVEFAPLMVTKATILCADAVAVTPGGVSLLDVDVSATVGLARMTVNDIAGAAGSANMFSFHYVAKEAGATTYSILIGLRGFGSAAT